MARLYVCDRCKAASGSWTTTQIEIPAPYIFSHAKQVELCVPCLKEASKLLNKFMETT